MPTPYLHPDAGRDEARLRLICLPFAGGGIGLYRSWAGAMPEGVEVLPVRLPGREHRLRERPFTAMPALADAVWSALDPLWDRPIALFGHSMGGAIAWELAQRAVADGRPPALLAISARRAPGTGAYHPPLFALPEAALIERLEGLYGPLAPALKRRPSMLRTFLPTLRADLQVIDTWQPDPTPLPDVPIVGWFGRGDVTTDEPSREGWRACTTGPVDLHLLPGGHFHVREHDAARDHLATRLAEQVREVA